MKRYFVAAAILLLFLPLAKAHAFGGCEEDCQKCHSLQTSEAQQILSKMKVPDSKVLDVKMSPVKGLWEVSVADAQGRRRTLYVGFSKKYIMAGPIIEVETGANKTPAAFNEAGKPVERYLDTSRISLDDDLLVGNKSAGNKVIVFTDPD